MHLYVTGGHPVRNEWSLKAIEMAVMYLQLHYSAGKYYIDKATAMIPLNADDNMTELMNYYCKLAASRFLKASLFYFDSADISSNLCVNSIIDRIDSDSIHGMHIYEWCMAAISLYQNEISQILQKLPYSLLLYW